jgi:hypothetical protein
MKTKLENLSLKVKDICQQTAINKDLMYSAFLLPLYD